MHFQKIFLCCLLLASINRMGAASVVLPHKSPRIELYKGLVAYYPFDGTANDASGNGNHGKFVNGSSLAEDKSGESLAALNLTGSGQKLVVQNQGNLLLDTAMTVSFHVLTRSRRRCNMVGTINQITGNGSGFVIGPAIPGNSNMIFSIVDFPLNCNAAPQAHQVSNIDAGMTLQTATWYHIVCTFNKGIMKMYVNGTLVGQRKSRYNKLHSCPGTQLLIGGWWRLDPQATMNGKIDELLLYKRELNEEEIRELTKYFRNKTT